MWAVNRPSQLAGVAASHRWQTDIGQLCCLRSVEGAPPALPGCFAFTSCCLPPHCQHKALHSYVLNPAKELILGKRSHFFLLAFWSKVFLQFAVFAVLQLLLGVLEMERHRGRSIAFPDWSPWDKISVSSWASSSFSVLPLHLRVSCTEALNSGIAKLQNTFKKWEHWAV